MRHPLTVCLVALVLSLTATAMEPFLITDFDGLTAPGYAFYHNSGSTENVFEQNVTASGTVSQVARVQWAAKWAGCEFVFDETDASAYDRIGFDFVCSEVLDKNIFVRLMTRSGNSLYYTFHMQTVVKKPNEVYHIEVKIKDLKLEKGTSARQIISQAARVQIGMETEKGRFAQPVVFLLDNVRLLP